MVLLVKSKDVRLFNEPEWLTEFRMSVVDVADRLFAPRPSKTPEEVERIYRELNLDFYEDCGVMGLARGEGAQVNFSPRLLSAGTCRVYKLFAISQAFFWR